MRRPRGSRDHRLAGPDHGHELPEGQLTHEIQYLAPHAGCLRYLVANALFISHTPRQDHPAALSRQSLCQFQVVLTSPPASREPARVHHTPLRRQAPEPEPRPLTLSMSQHQPGHRWRAWIQPKAREQPQIVLTLVLGELTPVLIDAAVRQHTVPAIASGHPDRNSAKIRGQHQTSERLQKQSRVEPFAE